MIVDPDRLAYLQATFNLDELSTYKALACAKGDEGDLAGAQAVLAEAAEKWPKDGGVRILAATMLPVMPESTEQITTLRAGMMDALAALEAEPMTIQDPIRDVGKCNFYLGYHGQDDRGLQEQIAATYRACCPALMYTAPHLNGRWPNGQYRGPQGKKIRVGFCSTYFRYHSVGKLVRGLIAKLDRSIFEVFVLRWPFSRGGAQDSMAQWISQHADDTWQLTIRDLATAQREVAAAKLDVLIFPDIGMDAHTYFLAFSRLAPVQVVMWGHPVTTGLDTLDYFLTSGLMEPATVFEHYTETPALLPVLPTYYYRPERDKPVSGEAAIFLTIARKCGEHVYLCPQSLFKIHPDCDAPWREILRRDPRGRLFVIQGLSNHWTLALKARWATTMADVAKQITVLPAVPTAEFLDLLSKADVLLDPLNWTGGVTTLEAISVGTPVVTLPGNFMRGRVTAGILTQMGENFPIAGSGLNPLRADPVEHYVNLAVTIAATPDKRPFVWAYQEEADALLYERQDAVTALEGFLEKAVDDASR